MSRRKPKPATPPDEAWYDGLSECERAWVDVLMCLCGNVRPPVVAPDGCTRNLTEDEYQQVMQYIGYNLTMPWSTVIGVVDAADALVQEAVMNGNIRRKA